MPSSKFVEAARRKIREYPDLFEAIAEFEHTGRRSKLGRKAHIDLTIDADLLREFRRETGKRQLKMSQVVESLVRERVKAWRRD